MNYTKEKVQETKSIYIGLLNKFRMTDFEHSSIMFETGCAFIENITTDIDDKKWLLSNTKSGFWDWYIVKFLDDDAILIKYINQKDEYVKRKWEMVMLRNLEDCFNEKFVGRWQR